MRYKMTYIFFLLFLLTTIPYIITIFINKDKKNEIQFDQYDSGYKVYNGKQSIDLEDYLLTILPGQISMDKDDETIKCQTIILRTDLIRKMGKEKQIKKEKLSYQAYTDEEYKNKLGEQAYKTMDRKRKMAVRDTIGMVIVYQGQLIEPYFHAISIGMTLDSKEWFGKNIPYLKQKESLSDIEAKDYMSVKTIEYQKIKEIVKEHMKKDISLSDISKKLKITKTTRNGYVKQVRIDQYLISGEAFATWFQLASNNFYFEEYKGKLRIICLGKGNGLGLSQYGAEKMARQGKTYKQILKYYYPKISIKKLYE